MDTRVLWRSVLVSVVLLVPAAVVFIPQATVVFVEIVLFFAPLWLPILLVAIFIPLWLTFVRSQYVANVPYTVLELKPGDETPKSAQAMELIYYSLHHRTQISRKMEFLVGQVRLPWSFEVAATGGTVRFFMRIPKSHRQALEMRIRAEFRDVDIDEIRDYAREVPFDPVSMRLKTYEYTLLKPDPYPLKTYAAYESTKNSKDPFVELLEDLVTVGEDEHVFISYIVRPHHRERKRFWEASKDALHEDAAKEIEAIVGSEGDARGLPDREKEIVRSIEDALKKPSFDCGIRTLYLADRNAYSSERAERLHELFHHFNDATLNEFTVQDIYKNISWPLSDLFSAVPWLYELHQYNLYRRRAYFSPPYYGNPFVLNTAELATVFHLPHISHASPLARGRGTRLEPPENLPV